MGIRFLVVVILACILARCDTGKAFSPRTVIETKDGYKSIGEDGSVDELVLALDADSPDDATLVWKEAD